ncbi:MAG: NAD(P)H-hydrate dehydratase [Gemmatimonadetes bacterium]|nr:NAD(P)H-hydrate dehydratase [Gemmatimonadota bacterium]
MFFPSEWWRVAAPEIWLPTSSEMAELDRAAIDSGSIPERALIENAGRALAQLVHSRYPSGRVLVVAGSGHNGADAFVAGRTLRAWGRSVEFLACGRRLPEPDVLVGWDARVRGVDDLTDGLARADLVLDGIFGTGLDTAAREPQATVIDRINRARASVIAVDGPSGLDFSTGASPGPTIQADLTVTFGWPKLGLLRFPGRERCGDIICCEIGFPPPASPPVARAITSAWAAELLGRRPADGHKGASGYVTLIGGAAGMAGAVALAASGAIRAGAGIVRVVSTPENREVVQTTVPSAIFVDPNDAVALDEALAWADAVGIGPGLGDEARSHVELALSEVDRPLVLDADALNACACGLSRIANAASRDILLTPHPGEAARLAGSTVDQIVADPIETGLDLSRSADATVLLKGAPTVIAERSGAARVATVASPAFATGGMGDVLTGVCTAYAAAGLAAADAATAALAVTGLAVETEFEAVGGAATDLPEALPIARAALETVTPGAWPGVSIAIPATVSSPHGSAPPGSDAWGGS